MSGKKFLIKSGLGVGEVGGGQTGIVDIVFSYNKITSTPTCAMSIPPTILPPVSHLLPPGRKSPTLSGREYMGGSRLLTCSEPCLYYTSIRSSHFSHFSHPYKRYLTIFFGGLMPKHSQGGEYPANWKEIAEKCKIEAGWKCIRCGWPHEPATGHCLTVHHLDMNPGNCEWWNLAALCQVCHLHIQAKVNIHQPYMFEHSEWFKPFVAGYHAQLFGLPTDREYVMANLERLLHIGYGWLIYGGE